MTELFAIRYITLRPTVSADEFEAFIARYDAKLPALSRVNWYIAKGDRGDRAERFALFFAYESVSTRDQYSDGVTMSVEVQEYWTAILELIVEWDKYGSSIHDLVLYTDYPVIAEF